MAKGRGGEGVHFSVFIYFHKVNSYFPTGLSFSVRTNSLFRLISFLANEMAEGNFQQTKGCVMSQPIQMCPPLCSSPLGQTARSTFVLPFIVHFCFCVVSRLAIFLRNVLLNIFYPFYSPLRAAVEVYACQNRTIKYRLCTCFDLFNVLFI